MKQSRHGSGTREPKFWYENSEDGSMMPAKYMRQCRQNAVTVYLDDKSEIFVDEEGNPIIPEDRLDRGRPRISLPEKFVASNGVTYEKVIPVFPDTEKIRGQRYGERYFDFNAEVAKRRFEQANPPEEENEEVDTSATLSSRVPQ